MARPVSRFSTFLLFALFFTLFSGVFLVSPSAQESRDALREYRLGNYDAAVGICLEELKATPSNMDSYVVLCWSFIALKRFDDAALYAERGRGLNRYDSRIVQALGEARFHQGRNDEALKLFQEYANLSPDGGRIDIVYYYIGEIYTRQGRFRHADIALSTAVRYAPGNAAWWTRLGYAREKASDNRYAAVAYEKALALDPQSADAKRGLERTRRALAPRN